MKYYYFVGVSLPALDFSKKPDIKFNDFDKLLQENLSASDYQKTTMVRLFFDIINLRSLWVGEKINPYGRFSAADLEEILITNKGLPDYIFDFLAKYHRLEDRLENFPYLLALFFQKSQAVQDPFLHSYFRFERELRLVMTLLRAKKLKFNVFDQLKYEDFNDEFVDSLNIKPSGTSFDIPIAYKEVVDIFTENADEPLNLQREIDLYRFNQIDSLIDMADEFSIHRILAYMVQLIIVEKWFELDKTQGLKLVESIAQQG